MNKADKCGKIEYTRGEAADRIKGIGKNRGISCKSYKCPVCKTYHITTNGRQK